ncbi:MAG: DNA polymerase I [Chlorobium sp.]|uniref:DNA polymerase I n=1 Tax=Chlorobium sp. TaxID=1095 RepID=UPI0025B8B10F|nr:DNA polymerase I [Chlorobium sp.]MCF8216756.1 DNA polymerase I [Chlorobium sp.]MCF8271624.1 DNA polymerase I [Chlorobium sp.]MCF8287996.1 DNA polymerase I [Chlorobium sp.]MCF8291541.1 DNA polymerase I [Chlorobium sp.]MCF8385675.1 DNA polymerase I [Chlorobium sp.]
MMDDRQFDFFGGENNGADSGAMPPGGKKKPELFLLDGMALVYRAYFALQQAGMRTRDGIPTGAMHGFAATLLKIYETWHPDYLAVAFDSREKTFRHKLYAPYKANRPAPPEDLVVQIEAIIRLIDAFGIPLIKMPGYEADDLIGSAARIFSERCRIYIVSPDKDLAQLVHEGVTMLKPSKKQNDLEPFGRKEIVEQFGVEPERFVDMLTLCGDTSDNIPGAKGIGPKTATALLLKYGSLDNIYKHIPELSVKIQTSLEAFRPQLELIRNLVTIDSDIDLALDLGDLACRIPDSTMLIPFLKKYELKSIAARLPATFPGITASSDDQVADNVSDKSGEEQLHSPLDGAAYRMIDTIEEVRELAVRLEQAEVFAVDTETTSLDVFQAKLVGISFSIEPKEAVFVYFGKNGLDLRKTLDILKPVLENPGIGKIGQNLKYDLLVLKNYGIALSPVSFDTMLASYVLDPEEKHNLDDLAARHLSVKTTTYDELTGEGKKRIPILDVSPPRLSDYACQDADLALRLQMVFERKLVDNEQLQHLCRSVEFPLVEVLAGMEYQGISIDTAHLEKTALFVNSQINELRENIFASTGSVFNIDSPKQLAHILFDVLGLPAKKTTKTGFSTNVEVLEELALLHPVAVNLLEYRSLQKLKTTYIDALPKMINPRTGRLHTSFNQHITATGRLSSSNPNLQNIPVRTLAGKEIRRAFIPSNPENLILSADYSQIELRIAAEISGDDKLIEAFRNREDIHSATAKAIFNTNEISSEMRRKAKEVNFGVLYGIQPFGLSKRLNIPRNEAKEIIDVYKSKYPGLFEALQGIIEEGRKTGFVATLLGRRRYMPDLNSGNGIRKKAAERAAMNTPIQGTAADIIKYAMNLCGRRMREQGMRSVMLLQVHDELLFETTPEERTDLEALAVDAMIDAARYCGMKNVPVEVDTGAGKNWMEAH